MSDVDADFGQPLDAHVIFVRYTLFAMFASIVNLATQAVVTKLAPWAPLMASVLVGTAAGFLVKYLLEKRWVFLDGYVSHVAELRKVIVYGLFSVGTTLLFWAIELGAWHLWRTDTAKYIGAAIGLGLGNWIKYLLDKRYVFLKAAP